MKSTRKIVLTVAACLLACLIGSLVIVTLLARPVLTWFCADSARRQGLSLTMDDCRVNPLTTHVVIRGLKLSNPNGFTNPIMLSVPDLEIDLEWLRSLWSGKPYFRRLSINVAELNIERRMDGVGNWDSLLEGRGRGKVGMPELALPENSQPDTHDTGKSPREKADNAPFTIERLNVSLGHIQVHDPQSPLLGELDVDAGLQNQVLSNISNRNQLAGEFLAAILPAIARPNVREKTIPQKQESSP